MIVRVQVFWFFDYFVFLLGSDSLEACCVIDEMSGRRFDYLSSFFLCMYSSIICSVLFSYFFFFFFSRVPFAFRFVLFLEFVSDFGSVCATSTTSTEMSLERPSHVSTTPITDNSRDVPQGLEC
jgi:hypothetical protein